MLSISPVEDRAKSAGSWFLRSGIQEQNGGVARYHRADLGRNAHVSTEITGYAVSALSYLYTRSGDAEFLKAAEKAASFLVEDAWVADPGVWPFEYGPGSGDGLTYFFDTGIIIRGLLALWRLTGDSKWLEAAVRGGESLRLFRSGEAFHPVIEVGSLQPLPYTPQWSRSSGCYQLKSALAWYDLSEASGRADFREDYERALRFALDAAPGFLPAETSAKTMDRLHAYSYFLEAIHPVTDRPETAQALRDGIDRVSGYLREIRSEFVRSDVYAQLLRVRLYADQKGIVPLNRPEAAEEAAAIPSFQLEDGGYSFGRRDGALIPHTNPVSAAFCMQALEMWNDFRNGSRLDLSFLI